eukprot:gb/GECH01002951.1/.p1 GENE.gb/GECH01002951.1/~~gb/GECH01002951.1/.p1  ORF type:complete len:499 (+),score=100.44 gb/GECH01002951.1/:1-1497(+)
MTSKKTIAIVGAGPGGLSSAMLLASKGFNVTVYEKEDRVGGRCSTFNIGDFKFDLGPTMLMMKYILDEVFQHAGKNSSDYLEYVNMEPMYQLYFGDGKHIQMMSDPEKMKDEFRRVFPEDVDGYDKFLANEEKRYDTMMPLLQRDWSSFLRFMSWDAVTSLPSLCIGRSLMDVLGDYFSNPEACLSFTFQAKYLGMSPWNCPGAYVVIPYVEHKHGVWYTKGGLGSICEAMAKVAEEYNTKIQLNTPIDQVLVDNGVANGVRLTSGEEIMYDEVIVNADFGYAATNLFPKETIRSWTPQKLEKSDLSCSTFMLYLCMDKKFDLPHHNIIFAEDYQTNITEISQGKMSDDFSIYMCNTCVDDDTMAPEGKSAVYVLVPCPNLRGHIDWEKSKGHYRNRTLEIIENRTGNPDFRQHIEDEKIYTPLDWQDKHNCYKGATFNLAHSLSQMLYFRPHNKFEDVDNCWLVGGGTHPGSGLPTIYESGRITARMLCQKYNIDFE